MKLSFNLLRPLIFFICGLGYLPLQSADVDENRSVASLEKIEKIKNKALKSNELEKKTPSTRVRH